VASQGHSTDEALANLTEAVELNLTEFDGQHPGATPLVTSFQSDHCQQPGFLGPKTTRSG
jgi:predicted RNase H-like HicB family nuclease